MARYIEDAGVNQPIDVVSMLMEDYIYHHRFMRTDWNGEPVFCCRDAHGKEWYLVWSYASGILHLEAWIKGAFGNEANLSGGSGKEYRKSLDELLKKLREHSGNTSNIGHIGEDPFIHKEAEAVKPVQPMPQQPKPVQPMPQQPAYQQFPPAQGMPYRPQGTSYGTTGAPYNPQGSPYGPQGNPYGVPGNPFGQPEDSVVAAAMIMGIIGIVLSFVMPLFGLILGLIGKSRSRMSDTTAGKGRTANILCTIAIILSVMGFFIPFIFMFMQF